MLRHVRENTIKTLWQQYRTNSSQVRKIDVHLKRKGIEEITIDHFAIIDLPGPHTGISHLTEIFKAIGYHVRGADYLPSKQNDFCWMAENNSEEMKATDVLPQVVVADFRLDAFPIEIRKIISFYANHAKASPIEHIQTLLSRLHAGEKNAQYLLQQIIMQYLAGREWPLPTAKEYYTVKEFNELLAWVLIFGRQPNHFTLSVHLLETFSNLMDFHQFITEDVQLELNQEGGVIKGGEVTGIAQGSTVADIKTVVLSDDVIHIPSAFVEFVWRYPKSPHIKKPLKWNEYFTGFVASHANHVIESLYEGSSS